MYNGHLRRTRTALVLLYTSPVSRQEQQELQAINWVCIWQVAHTWAGIEHGPASNTHHKGNHTVWKRARGASSASHWNTEHSQLWGHQNSTPEEKQVLVQSKPGCLRAQQGSNKHKHLGPVESKPWEMLPKSRRPEVICPVTAGPINFFTQQIYFFTVINT